MLHRCCGDDKVERSLVHAFSFSAEFLSQRCATASNLRGELDNRNPGEHVAKATLGPVAFSRGCPQRSLVHLHVAHDAESDAFGGDTLDKLDRVRQVCQVVNEPVGIDEIRHLRRPAAAVLSPGVADVLEELLPIDTAKHSFSAAKRC